MTGRTLRLILGLILWIPFVVSAAEFRLFSEQGEAHKNYNNILPLLKKDDVLVFSHGERFQLSEILGHGNTTLILGGSFESSAEKVALRVPLFQGYFSAIRNVDFEKRRSYLLGTNAVSQKRLLNQNGLLEMRSSMNYTDYLNSTIDTQKEYLALGAPVLPILKESRGEYIAVPVVQADPKTLQSLSLQDLMKEKWMRSRYPEAVAALPELARRMARVSRVGDFGLRQVLFDFPTKTWILTDWLGYPDRTRGFAAFGSGGHPLIVSIGVHDKELAAKLEKVMDREKARLRSVGGSCSQLLRSFFVGL